jgi:glutamyl-tRNA synthetase
MGLIKKSDHTHLSRWFSHLDNYAPCIEAMEEIVAEKNNKAVSEIRQVAQYFTHTPSYQNKPAQKQAASFDIFLGGEAKEGQVVTRFPPEPSGYLHVGHAKAAILNQYFARKYKGKLIIRFDDTNPSKEKVEFEDSIIEDLALLGIKADATSHTSDYFDELYRLAMTLIKSGDAYADDTLQEEMRAQRMDGIASARRESTVEETVERFAEMMTGSEEGKRWCLRAKMSVDNPNKAMRDPVIYRVNVGTPHHRTGTTWKVYPTYDFACPVVDSIEGVTHALRTNEYRDRNPQYAWMLEKLHLRQVNIWDFGRLNFVYTLLSKRKLQWFVDRGLVTGWDDPRFPTVRGIRRRGMTIDCIQQFILATGPSQQVINMEWDSIWTINKRILDPVVPRFTAVEEKDMVKCQLSGGPGFEEKQLPKHRKNAELGDKTVVFDDVFYIDQKDAASFADGEEITLMNWGNVIVKKIDKDGGGLVTGIQFDANLQGDFQKTEKKVTWLASDKKTSRKLIKVRLLDYDYLITKRQLEEEDKFEDFLTKETIFETDAVADFSVTELKNGDAIQFERKGYYILDKDQGRDGRREFIRIPDGKVESSKSKAAGDGDDTTARKRKAQEEREQKKIEKAKKDEEKAKKKAEKKAGGGEAAVAAVVAAGAAVVGAVGAAIGNGAAETQHKSNMYKVKPIVPEFDASTQKTNMYKMKSIN